METRDGLFRGAKALASLLIDEIKIKVTEDMDFIFFMRKVSR